MYQKGNGLLRMLTTCEGMPGLLASKYIQDDLKGTLNAEQLCIATICLVNQPPSTRFGGPYGRGEERGGGEERRLALTCL